METSDPADGLTQSFGRFGGWHAVTVGDRGALWTDDGVTIHHQSAFAVDVVDTLGAGDVLHGAFAAGLARGQGEAEALRWASAAAALKCTRHGGRAGIPTLAELERFLEEQL
jgi:sulfofructose kinase